MKKNGKRGKTLSHRSTSSTSLTSAARGSAELMQMICFFLMDGFLCVIRFWS